MENRFVVCIHDVNAPTSNKGVPRAMINTPKKGEIYTVIGINNAWKVPGYFLEELEGFKCSFSVNYFRPVQNMDAEIEWVESTLMKDAVLEETLKQLAI